MEHVIQYNTQANQAQYNKQTNHLMGEPIKITYFQEACDNLENVVSLHKTSTTPPARYTRIAARIDTTKGTIDSWFLAISDIEGKICNIRTNNNHSVANLKGQIVFFHSPVKGPMKTREGEHHLPDVFYQFHRWLVSEITENLNQSGFFSSLHGATEIQSFVLNKPPKLCSQV